MLVICAVTSLVDGILTLRYGKYLSSFLLFTKQHLTIDGKINLLTKNTDEWNKKTNEWNQKQSDNKLLIQAETEDMCKGRLFNLWWPVSPVSSNSRNDRVSYEERGPVTGLRICRKKFYIWNPV